MRALWAPLVVFGLFAKPETLPVEVYNHAASVPLREVGENLRRILASSSVQLAWTTADKSSPEANMIVFGGKPTTRSRPACAAKRSISLRIAAQAPSDPDDRELGFSLPFAPRGLNVVVYFDRVSHLSGNTGVPLPNLLAHVIAHEIGHVLLRSEEHTASDLMTDTWREPEFARMRQGRLGFSPAQGAQIRATLAASCPASSTGSH